MFLPFCQKGTPQLTLLIKMQEFCYDNMNFLKVFHKIVLLFYKSVCLCCAVYVDACEIHLQVMY